MIIRTNEYQTADERVEFIAEAIETDMHDQFEGFYYTIDCNTCGKTITTALLSRDFDKGSSGFYHQLVQHNMTHYVMPMIHRCKHDDVFGVDHSECNHQVTVNADGSFS